MNLVSALLAVLAQAQTIEGGLKSFYELVATLHAGGGLTADQIKQIRDDGSVEDAQHNALLAAAQERLQA